MQDVVEVHGVHEDITKHLSLPSGKFGAASRQPSTAAGTAALTSVTEEADPSGSETDTACRRATPSTGIAAHSSTGGSGVQSHPIEAGDADAPLVNTPSRGATPAGGGAAAASARDVATPGSLASTVSWGGVEAASADGDGRGASRDSAATSSATTARSALSETRGRLSFAALGTADRETCHRALVSSPGCLLEEVPAAEEIDVDTLEDVSSGDWGLDMLVKVGEAWAPALLTMTECAPRHASRGSC